MILAERVSKSFGASQVLAQTTLALKPERTTVLIGPSGCGKSTLLRLMMGLVEPDSGHVIFDGTELTRENGDRLRHQMGYVIQDGGLFPHLSARQNVVLLARFLGRSRGWIGERVGSWRQCSGSTPPLSTATRASFPAASASESD